MKKSTTVAKSPTRKTNRKQNPITIGMDLGDKSSRYCVLDEDGDVLLESSVGTTKKGMCQAFGAMQRCRIAIEVGTHSPWVSRDRQGAVNLGTLRCSPPRSADSCATIPGAV